MSGAETPRLERTRYTDQDQQQDPARDVLGLALRTARGDNTDAAHRRAGDHTGINLIAEEIGGRASSQVRGLKNVKTPKWPDESALPDVAAFKDAVMERDDERVRQLASQICHFVSGYKPDLSIACPRYFEPGGVVITGIYIPTESYGSLEASIDIRLDNGKLTLYSNHGLSGHIESERIDTAPHIKEMARRMRLIK